MGVQIQRVTMKGILCKDGKILFVKDRKGGKWELPGGKVNFGEHPIESLRRELEEELKLTDVTIGRYVHVWDFTSTVQESEYQFIVMVYECISPSVNINLSDEHIDYQWLNVSQLTSSNSEYPMREGYLTAVHRYLELTRKSDA